MLKEIAIEQLVVDMYIAELIGKDDTMLPKKKRGMVRDERIIKKFSEIGIIKVIIDTDRGLDLFDASASAEEEAPLDIEQVDSAIKEGLANIMLETSTQYRDLQLEWGTAKEVFDTSVSIVTSSIETVKKGQDINPEYFRQASSAISKSVLRNKDALTWLGRFRDVNSYLYEHSVNSAVLMGIFAHAYGLSESEVEQCINGALLHDLGEAKVAPDLFDKEGALTDEEYQLVQGHVGFGLTLLDSDMHASVITASIIREHHERMDGSGYPSGLAGDHISIYGKMFAIVDTYDAVTNKRTYKDAVPSSVGMRTLLELAGNNFDESLVHQFIKCMGVYPTGSLVLLNNNILAVVIAQTPGQPLKPLVRTAFSKVTMAFVEPRMLNLSHEDHDIRIKSYEDPRDYGIEVNEFMPEDFLL